MAPSTLHKFQIPILSFPSQSAPSTTSPILNITLTTPMKRLHQWIRHHLYSERRSSVRRTPHQACHRRWHNISRIHCGFGGWLVCFKWGSECQRRSVGCGWPRGHCALRGICRIARSVATPMVSLFLTMHGTQTTTFPFNWMANPWWDAVAEGCNDAQFTVIRPELGSDVQDTLYLDLAGSALLGDDSATSTKWSWRPTKRSGDPGSQRRWR